MFNLDFRFKLFIAVSQFTLTYFAISMDRHLQDIKDYITTQQPVEFDVVVNGGCGCGKNWRTS
jgi:hypothetical protein